VRICVTGARRGVVPVIVIGIVLAVVGGCATIAKAAFSQPVVSLRDVRVAAIGLDGGTFDVLLSVYNPNEFNLDASSITYSVLVDSAIIGTGSAEERVVVPARDSAVVRLPLHVRWATAGPAGQALMRSGSVLYQVKGEMKIASGVGTMTLPYDQRGRFSALGRR